ncbi:MAG: acyloxyacyl hydrolase [Gammaproteobacteria bacterium]|nr:acyloxyacyl hydrolase [Gammaproteobacteria bacterium]
MRTIATNLLVPLLLLAQVPAMASSPPNWIDAVSFTLGKDDNSNDTGVYRIGFQNKWERSWFEGGAWFLSGYWDTELGYLETDIGVYNELVDVSVTPVLRLQRDADLSSGVTPYAEAGFGPHLISETRLGRRILSTAFQFGSLIGLGVGFGERGQYELSYRFQHISNADIKTPNDGLELHLLRLGYNFE